MPETSYTPERANAALPLVSAIVRDVVELGKRAADLVERYQKRKRDPSASQLELNEARQDLRTLTAQRNACAAELAELGVQLKDADVGLVDFPCDLDGERVLLCWKHGEPRVEWWHRETEGFAGRKPLPVPVLT